MRPFVAFKPRRALAHALTLPLLVYHISQDDRKKNTARKLARFELVELMNKVQRIPRGAILLDPFAEIALSPADAEVARTRGVVALDCSWRLAEQVFPSARAKTVPRALPWMLAANPVNYGKAFQLSTAEALAATCRILGEREQAEALMSKFIWGPGFLTLNENPLDDYAAARTSREVVAAQLSYIPEDEGEEAAAELESGAAPADDGDDEDALDDEDEDDVGPDA